MTSRRLNADVFALISNIPDSFHSQDLRNYFSQFVEERRFKCFHFRNRPEQRLNKGEKHVSLGLGLHPDSESDTSDIRPSDKSTVYNYNNMNAVGTESIKLNRKCCVIKIVHTNLKAALHLYHKKPWVDRSGNAMGIRCFIVGIKVPGSSEGTTVTSNPNLVSFTRDDLTRLPELNPPEIMPHGNVGTATQTFLQLIRDCKVPPSVIKKLGLSFPKRRSNRRYGNVPFQYGTSVFSGKSVEVAVTGTGQDITDDVGLFNDDAMRMDRLGHTEKEDRRTGESSDSEEDDDDDVTCEEWERHEAFHDDVTKQNRTEERLFEEQMEIVWDKGSSGLVFYTDAAYWDAMKGDFDERTSDEWDVDMSIFYEKDGGTKDAKDWLLMQKEARIQRGEEDTSVFTKNKIGQFESHTKGVGRQLMNQMGWRDGDGLGKSKAGISDALENEGQTPKDRRGFGYHGEKLCRYPVKKKPKTLATISTAYDDIPEIDPPTPLLRSNEPTYLKHRDVIV